MAQTGELIPPPNRKRWTRSECDVMRETGILTGRYELIDGEVISKMGQKPPHSLTVVRLYAWLTAVFGALFVRTQLPIDADGADPDHNEPEPDVAVTAESNNVYADRHPGPADLLLAVEVSDTTLRYDLIVKGSLYARAGIREYWVVDLTGRQVFVHRGPTGDGYTELTAYHDGESVAPMSRQDDSVRVGDLLPPLV